MASSFVVYIDEAGDEGFVFEKGSSEWFVISAVIVRKNIDLDIVKLVAEARTVLDKKRNEEIHFRKIKHEQRLAFVNLISQFSLRRVSVLIHKPSIKDRENFQARYRLYFYTTRYLLERVSWCCRDHYRESEGDRSAEVIFSNRSGMSYDELGKYIERLRHQEGVNIDWSVIKSSQITSYVHSKRAGLQVADAVASSFYYAVQKSRYGFVEDRYVRMLRPIAYNYKGKCVNYGLKFWPKDVDVAIGKETKFAWVRDVYGGI